MLISQPRDGILQFVKILGNFIWNPFILLFTVLSIVLTLLFNCTFTALCYSTKLPTSLLKFKMAFQLEKLTVAVMERKLKHTVEEQEVHTVEVLASIRDLDDFSN